MKSVGIEWRVVNTTLAVKDPWTPSLSKPLQFFFGFSFHFLFCLGFNFLFFLRAENESNQEDWNMFFEDYDEYNVAKTLI
jgi:hypothetical protein